MKTPNLPLLTPLRGIDTSYTNDSIARRLPEILQRTLAENILPDTAVSQLETLLNDIPNGKISQLPDHLAPDLAAWQVDIVPYLGQGWLEVPWFFVETYFYRRFVAAVDHFRSGIDPFDHQKRQSLITSTARVQALISQVNQLITDKWQPDSFTQLLLADLWGNQADMSMWAVGDDAMPNHTDAADQTAHLLVDDETAVTQLLQKPVGQVDFINDNAGFELIGDLCLADYFLATEQAAAVHFHLKLFPTFVSDATVLDVETTLAYLNQQNDPDLKAAAGRLVEYLINGRLRLTTHPFWTSPHPLWHFPFSLRQKLASADLVICKGDANYRRALGDMPWPQTTALGDIVNYFPTPILFLRTAKSEVLVGLTEAKSAKMAELKEDWLVNGRWGVIQLA
jgi:uncharacterized protein with ATP-grasp and redox domains